MNSRLALTIVFCWVTVPALTAGRDPTQGGGRGGRPVQIVSGAGKCLDVDAPNQFNDGARVQVWQCSGAQPQQWYLVGNEIKSAAGKCLDVDAPKQFSNGGRVQVWQCSGTQPQQWYLVGNEIRSAAGKCLDVHAPDQYNDGALVQVWDCTGALGQRWSVR